MTTTGDRTITPCTTDPEAWFATSGNNLRHAQEACAHCPMIAQCARAALDANPSHGVWAGINMGGFESIWTKKRNLRRLATDRPSSTWHKAARQKRDIDRQTAIQLRVEGATIQEVADALRCSRSHVSQLLHGTDQSGIKRADLSVLDIPDDVRKPKTRVNSWTPERVMWAEKMFELGASCKQVGRELGVSGQTVIKRFPQHKQVAS